MNKALAGLVVLVSGTILLTIGLSWHFGVPIGLSVLGVLMIVVGLILGYDNKKEQV